MSLQHFLTAYRIDTAALARIRAGHGKRIAAVVHLAGYYDLSGDPDPKYHEVTVRGTERLLRVARTVADLEASGAVEINHLEEAARWRPPSSRPAMALAV